MTTNLQSLQLFVAVVEKGGVNAAARSNHLVPSAVSKHIAALEEQFGIALFVRSRGRLRLSEAGTVFLYHARRVLLAASTLEAEIAAFRDGVVDRVVVACNTSALNLGLAGMIEEFSRAMPSITVMLKEGRSEEVIAALHDRSADIGLLTSMVPIEGLEHVPWASSRLAAVYAASRPLPKQGEVAFADLLDHGFVVLSDGNRPDALARFLANEATRLGAAMQIRMSATSVMGLSALLVSDVGIAVLPECTTRKLAQDPLLVSVPLSDRWAVLDINLAVRQNAILSAPAWALYRHLGERRAMLSEQ